MYSKCKYFIKLRLRRFARSPDLLSKACGDASYCNLLLRIKGIALQGSFLHTWVPGFAWSHAIRSKGTGLHPRRLSTSCCRLHSDTKSGKESLLIVMDDEIEAIQTCCSSWAHGQPFPERQDDANPKRTRCPLALDSEIPAQLFVATELSRISSKWLR